MSIDTLLSEFRRIAPPGKEAIYDRAALARLRRADNPKGIAIAFRHLAAAVEENERIEDYALVALLFGHNPYIDNTEFFDIGRVCAMLLPFESEDAADRRFNCLLSCDREGLGVALTRIAKQAARYNIPINFTRLFYDIARWDDPKKPIQIAWSRSYYAPSNRKVKGDSHENIKEEL